MKKLYTAVTAVIIAALCLFLFTGCGEKVYEIDGVEVSNFKVVQVEGDFFSFRMRVVNKSKEDKFIDASKITLQVSDGAGIPHMGGIELSEAESDDEMSFIIDDSHPKMKKGDKVTVFLEGKKLCEIKITDFDS